MTVYCNFHKGRWLPDVWNQPESRTYHAVISLPARKAFHRNPCFSQTLCILGDGDAPLQYGDIWYGLRIHFLMHTPTLRKYPDYGR